LEIRSGRPSPSRSARTALCAFVAPAKSTFAVNDEALIVPEIEVFLNTATLPDPE
jgi:hypothetical protein